MKELFAILISLNVFFACNNPGLGLSDGLQIRQNIFDDSVMRKIYELQDKNDIAGLRKYLNQDKAKYRRQVALAFAAIQNEQVLADLYRLLFDQNEEVQLAAAYAIGQIGSSKAEERIIDLYLKADKPKVKAALLEALGKSGTARSLALLIEQTDLNQVVNTGRLWGIARLAFRGVRSDQALALNLKVLSSSGASEEQKYVASVYLANLDTLSKENWTRLKSTYSLSKNQYTRANIIKALERQWGDSSKHFAQGILASQKSFEMVQLVQVLPQQAYDFVYRNFDALLLNKNTNVAIATSEYLLKYPKSQHARMYLSRASADMNWRVSANLYHAAIKADPSSESVAMAIRQRLEESKNTYEKAFMLRALGEHLGSYQYVAKYTFDTTDKVLSTYGMEALVNMRQSARFDYYNDRLKAKGGVDLYKEFALIMKQAVASNETPLIAQASKLLRKPDAGFLNAYPNTYFLTQALHRLEMPRQMAAYVELSKTVAYFNGEEVQADGKTYSEPIDWEYVQQIKQGQQVKVSTTKGDILFRLRVNEAPASVSQFMKLAEAGFYNGLATHSVVPNLLVKSGCVRGDGWGGAPNTAIHAAYTPLRYKSGSVGMVAVGKDTASSQWFITNSPDPELDGAVTIFAEVEKGMEVVERLEIGDRITKVLLN